MLAMRRSLLLLLATAKITNAQAISSLPACGQQCITNVLDQSLGGCTANDASCLCKVSDFGSGVRDCAVQACGADVASTVTSAASAMCATATLAVTSSTAPPPPPSSTPPPASSTAAPVIVASSSASVTSTASVAQNTAAVSSSGTLSSTLSTSTSTSSNSSKTTARVSGASATTSTTASSSNASSSAETTSGSSSSTLSIGAKAGIGIGAAAGAAAIVAITVCMIVRRRHGAQAGNSMRTIQISDPLPGSGRAYANDHHHAQYETGLSELEMKSRRYEDMVPRHSPRHMV